MRTSFVAVLTLVVSAASAAADVKVIPEPVSVRPGRGHWKLDARTAILLAPDTPAARAAANAFARAVAGATGFSLPIAPARRGLRQGAVVLAVTETAGSAGSEAYTLDANEKGVRIEAAGGAGLFYGVQTLLQLLPPEIESPTRGDVAWVVPCVRIEDQPRLAWRGVMLDVSRHFFDKAFLKRYIDEMARYKLNVFHLHLTDDNGWRIEIKSRPQLTSVGAWRVPRFAKFGTIEPPRPGEAATDGGFYTQDDIRELVSYAAERFVTIVPEIEMPGHSQATVASYPELSCTGLQYYVNPGLGLEGADNVLCPGNDQTFEFIEQVLSEVAALFPSKYIHIGGDECDKAFWKKCPKCQRRMAQEHLANEDELHSYLVRRASRILESKGKRLIGWDDILDGGLAPGAAVMSWRGTRGGIAAAKMNHQAVMSPASHSYLDFYQGDSTLEPTAYAKLLLSTCYGFDPVPADVDAKFILGAQMNLFTEYVPHPRHVEYMTWPRGMALAEVYWSPKKERSWDDFFGRVEAQFPRLDAAKVNYSRAVYDAAIKPLRDAAGNLAVTMSTEVSGCEIYYTVDGTNPDLYTPRFQGRPVTLPPGAFVVKAMAYRDGRPSGRMLSLTTQQLAERLPNK